MPSPTHPTVDDRPADHPAVSTRPGPPTAAATGPAPDPAADPAATTAAVPAVVAGAMPRSTPLVARGLRLTYPGATRPALDGVDLVVHPGECLALLGPNGAGKTTLIRTATGLRAPDAGTVRIAGGDPRRADVRAALGVMLQETAFPSHLTVGELVAGAAVRAGRPTHAVAAVLDEVGMTDLATRRSHHLSGGQRRRLQLARALVVEPTLLVLDEPTEGLDAESRRATWDNLAARRDAGMAILLTTHLVAEAGSVADRVAVIADGRIVADASPDLLVDRLPDRAIHVHTTLPLDRVRALPTVDRTTRTPGTDGHDPTTCIATRAPEQVLRRLLVDDPDATGLRVVGASLEDAVLAITDTGTPHDRPPTSRPDLADRPADRQEPA